MKESNISMFNDIWKRLLELKKDWDRLIIMSTKRYRKKRKDSVYWFTVSNQVKAKGKEFRNQQT